MNKRYFFTVAFLLLSMIASAQCVTLPPANAEFNKGNYKDALKYYSAAIKCPDVIQSPRLTAEIKNKVNVCKKRLQANSTKPTTTPTNNPAVAAKPQVEVLYSDYISANCNNGRRGAELNVIFEVKNMKGKQVQACCLISPLSSDGKVIPYSDPTGEYTVQNGMSGQEHMITIGEEEEYISLSFFVPFSVMNFEGNYSAQNLKSELTIKQSGTNTMLASNSQLYDNLETHTVAVRDHVDSCDIESDYLGGGIGWENFSACSGNKILFTNLPDWMTEDEYGLHVMDNDAPDSRRASIYVTSSEGGNSVKVNIIQEGRSEDQKATAVINEVWMEEKVYDSRDDIGVLKIHVDCEVTGARGKEIRVYALFYKADGKTPLENSNGQIMFFNKSRAAYAESRFGDFPLLTFYNRFTHAINNSTNTVTYYIGISEDEGESFMTKKGPYTVTW